MKSRSSIGPLQSRSPTDYYFERFGFCQRQILVPTRPDLGLVVVIPCFNEPDLVGALDSLWKCERPTDSVEVIIVINSSADSPLAVRTQNQHTFDETTCWINAHRDELLTFHVLHFRDLPSKQAGVGLARKVGMDEALRRFNDLNKPDGVIACFDADCRCDSNYLSALQQHFQRHPKSPGCSIYFEHPLAGSLDSRIYDAVILYELHLRYYVRALQFAGFPFAHHTIGSCMAVRADAYRRQGGMNKRRAGEDFYFLNKIIPPGNFTNLTDTTVRPSPRVSDRVPFGTGRAVGDYLTSGQFASYPLQAFLDLKHLFEHLPALFADAKFQPRHEGNRLPDSVSHFLGQQDFTAVLRELRENTSTETAFRKRFFRWFDAFRVMKFIHHARDSHYGPGQVEMEAMTLLELLGIAGHFSNPPGCRGLLEIYRRLDRVP